jgi:hypothetical protein
MPTQKQSRLYWLKWIDRQYAKADPAHVKMPAELPAKGEEDFETADAGDSLKKRTKEQDDPKRR